MRPTVGGWRWTCWAGVIALSVVVLAVIAGWHQRTDPSFARSDEQAHYDYVVDLSHGTVPAWGDHYNQVTLRMLSCLGVADGRRLGCAVTTRNPHRFAPDGYNYEAQQPPLAYLPYLLTANIGASPAHALSAARRGGIIWTVLTAGLLVWLGWVTELSLLELAALMVLCLLSPVEVRAASTVNNDSSAVAAGALTVITATTARRRQARFGALGFAVGIVMGLLKGLFLVAPFILLLTEAITEVRRRSWRGGRTIRGLYERHACVIMMLLGAAVSYGAWYVVQDWRGTVTPSVVNRALLGGRIVAWPQWSFLFTSIEQQMSLFIAYSPSPLYWIWNLSVFGTLAALWLRPESDLGGARMREPASATLLGLTLYAAGIWLFIFVQTSLNSTVPVRYALAVLPIIGLVVVRSVRRAGLVAVGMALPGVALIAQLAAGKF